MFTEYIEKLQKKFLHNHKYTYFFKLIIAAFLYWCQTEKEIRGFFLFNLYFVTIPFIPKSCRFCKDNYF